MCTICYDLTTHVCRQVTKSLLCQTSRVASLVKHTSYFHIHCLQLLLAQGNPQLSERQLLLREALTSTVSKAAVCYKFGDEHMNTRI